MTRSAAKRSQAIRIYEEPAREESLVAHVYERDLKNYGEAIRSSKREGWEKALRQDLKALEYNGVWRLIKRSPSSNALHTKWVFKTKTDAHGYLERLEARLVACGNEQVFGIYYHLNFAAVMDMATVKVLLAFVATWGVPAKHGDIPNTYVKADKESNIEILLQVTQAMEVDESTLKKLGAASNKELALELRKRLYGLKQAGRLWSHLLDAKLCSAEFTQCVVDICLYWKRDGNDTVVVGVYVDDLLATGTGAAAVDRFFYILASLLI